MDNRKNSPAGQRRPGSLNDAAEGEVNYYAVPGEWDDEEGLDCLEEAHEALLKLQQKTHKRAQIQKRNKPIEGWH